MIVGRNNISGVIQHLACGSVLYLYLFITHRYQHITQMIAQLIVFLPSCKCAYISASIPAIQNRVMGFLNSLLVMPTQKCLPQHEQRSLIVLEHQQKRKILPLIIEMVIKNALALYP
jgi:hypothetical protein